MRNVIIMRFYEVSFIFLLILLEGITIFGKKKIRVLIGNYTG